MAIDTWLSFSFALHRYHNPSGGPTNPGVLLKIKACQPTPREEGIIIAHLSTDCNKASELLDVLRWRCLTLVCAALVTPPGLSFGYYRGTVAKTFLTSAEMSKDTFIGPVPKKVKYHCV